MAAIARKIGDIQGPDHAEDLEALARKRRNATAVTEKGARELNLTEENLENHCVYLAIEPGGEAGWYVVSNTYGDLIELTDGAGNETRLTVDELVSINGEDIVVADDIDPQKLFKPAPAPRRVEKKKAPKSPEVRTEVRGIDLEPGDQIFVEDFEIPNDAPFTGVLTVEMELRDRPDTGNPDIDNQYTKVNLVLVGTDDSGRTVSIMKNPALMNDTYRLAS